MSVSKRSKNSKKSSKVSDGTETTPKGSHNSLLDFVSSLDGMDVPEEAETFQTFADLDSSEVKPSSKKSKKAKVLKLEDDASVDDFTAVIDNDDSGFSGLKKKMSLIQGDEEKIGKVKVLEAPLPTFQQSQIDRSVAYEKTAKDVSKWSHIIQKNRDSEQLKFPLPTQEASVSISSHTLVSTFNPVTDMEKEISGLIARDGITPKLEAPEGSISVDSDALPTIQLNPDQVYRELAKSRSSKFFAEIKAKRQAKIKSKKYRKMLTKERMRAEAEAIATGNLSELARLGLASSAAEDDEIRRERRMNAEMERARERLTLKTRKVNKWAHDLLIRKHGDADGRLRVLEQIKEKERLRQEIYGVADKFDSTDDDESEEEVKNDEESENDDGFDNINDEATAEVQDIFNNVKAEHAVVTGRHKFGPSQFEQRVESENFNDDSDTEFEAELNNKIVKQSKKAKANAEVSVVDDVVASDEDDTTNMTELKWKSQSKLIREAFAEDDVFSEFAAEKKSVVDSEAPKTEDITLPGWGVWGGAGISEKDSKSKTRVLMHKKGLDPRARLDKDLKHVIINERRIKSAARAFTIPSVPFPFTSAEMHARHIAQPIGKEWNTVTSYKKRIQPRIVTKAGSIIKPIKFFKQAKHV